MTLGEIFDILSPIDMKLPVTLSLDGASEIPLADGLEIENGDAFFYRIYELEEYSSPATVGHIIKGINANIEDNEERYDILVYIISNETSYELNKITLGKSKIIFECDKI